MVIEINISRVDDSFFAVAVTREFEQGTSIQTELGDDLNGALALVRQMIASKESFHAAN